MSVYSFVYHLVYVRWKFSRLLFNIDYCWRNIIYSLVCLSFGYAKKYFSFFLFLCDHWKSYNSLCSFVHTAFVFGFATFGYCHPCFLYCLWFTNVWYENFYCCLCKRKKRKHKKNYLKCYTYLLNNSFLISKSILKLCFYNRGLSEGWLLEWVKKWEGRSY